MTLPMLQDFLVLRKPEIFTVVLQTYVLNSACSGSQLCQALLGILDRDRLDFCHLRLSID
jgi:hypothetical protein